MAGMTSAARMHDAEDFDYSTSHRHPPTVPTTAASAVTETQRVQKLDAATEEGATRDYASSVRSQGRRRRASFSFLRRSSAHNTTPAGAPPLPTEHLVQAQQEGATAAAAAASARVPEKGGYERHVAPTTGRHNRSLLLLLPGKEGGSKMLRKRSRNKAEQERLAREALAQRASREAPRLPRQVALPGIGQFGDDDGNRPDSYAIFNKAPYSAARQSAEQQRAPANFSRPGANMSSSNTHSSSPAYAIRSGNAFAQQVAMSSSPPAVGATAGKSSNGEYVIDPIRASTESGSMAHRGRYSSASTTAPYNSPRRVRRRKDPTPFNILVVGAKNSGKTSFISFLRHSLALPETKEPYNDNTVPSSDSEANAGNSSFTSHYLATELEGERVGLTLWDSAGLEKHIIDLQLREMAAFVEAKFEETFLEEQKVQRTPGVKDTHIHCVLLVLDPVRLDATVAASSAAQRNSNGNGIVSVGGLDDEMDLQVIRALWGKTTVIPVVAKADTLTVGHMNFLKKSVWESLKGAKLDPLEALELEGEEDDDDTLDEEDEDAEDRDGVIRSLEREDSDDIDGGVPTPKRFGHGRNSSLAASVQAPQGDESPYIPMSILSPDPYDLPPYTMVSKGTKIGRRFPWGFADPYDQDHCDFVRLRDSIFSEWRGDLRDLARTKWYENWRTSRLKNLPGSGRQRVKGGVTPSAVVPREGRSSPQTVRNFSSGGQNANARAQQIPRSVSASTNATGGATGQPTGLAVGDPTRGSTTGTSKAERLMGISASDAASAVSRGGQYRPLATYQ